MEPYGIRQTAKFRWQRAIMPYAMGFRRNTQKPKENHHISSFCAARDHGSESFFREFSLLGALWGTSGRPLATLGRSVSALGSSLAALGGHLAPNGSTRDPCHPSPPVTRFWGPKALCREPKVDGQGPNAIGHGLSAKYTKTKGKPCFFMVRRCSGACFGDLFW